MYTVRIEHIILFIGIDLKKELDHYCLHAFNKNLTLMITFNKHSHMYVFCELISNVFNDENKIENFIKKESYKFKIKMFIKLIFLNTMLNAV